MYKLTSLFMLALGALSSVQAATNVTNIKDCPALSPRDGPKNVHDLRMDDIKVVGAMGDSITAGALIMGFNNSESPIVALTEALNEFRGLSYSIGGDEDALTIPNYIKHYQSNVTGYSIGEAAPTSPCNDKANCTNAYSPQQDRLNAAISGAIARDLDEELDYLIPSMKEMQDIDFENDWKMINIQIGSNDMCAACNETLKDEVSAEKFGSYVEAAVARIRDNVPKVLVNLIGVFNVSEVFTVTAGQDYCYPKSIDIGQLSNNLECSCSNSTEGTERMANLTAAYNDKLKDIYHKYQENKSDTFAIVYQQANLNITGFPIEFFNNLDCFHPSLLGHQWVSKIIWNQLFSQQAMKPNVFNFNYNETIYCPIDSDRIATN